MSRRGRAQLRERQRALAQWDSLTPEQQSLLQLKATHDLLANQYTTLDDGSAISLWDLAIDRELEVLKAEQGFGTGTREDPETVISRKPGWLLRPGKPKMNLRPEEEARLELELMGRGFNAEFSPLHDIPWLRSIIKPKVNFAYGIFCKGKRIKSLLAPQYAGRAPGEMLEAEQYYQQLILRGPQLELTSMVVLARDMPLDALAQQYAPLLRKQVEAGITVKAPEGEQTEGKEGKRHQQDAHYPAEPADMADLKYFTTLFTPAVLKGLPFVSPDGKKLLADTKLFFSCRPDGGFSLEAETPGKLAQQTPYFLGEFNSKQLTYAVFDAFMGRSAIDPVARLDIGACFLYFANGFNFDHESTNPNQFLATPEFLANKDKYVTEEGEVITSLPRPQLAAAMPQPASLTLRHFQLAPPGGPAVGPSLRPVSFAPFGFLRDLASRFKGH